ncbi:MAG: PEP-CTERM sorting domain-containing protein [Phycisphaerales bacterium]|nr:PEP-CTERM sorting domain-containing protein [Phycisphaerales bacterium]MCB9855482.1 PEP-CTERM sorting domain-containing protein [Phycisphaerales bacterium]
MTFVVAVCGRPAVAELITFDFANLSPNTPSSQVTRTISVGSLDLTVSALGQDEDALPNATETEAVSYVAGSGLGVRDITDLLVSDIDAVDGNRGNEELVFTFDDDVIFKNITFVDASGQNFAGEVFFLLNECEFGDFNGVGNRIAFFNAFGGGGAGNPQWQALPNYTFPANQQGPKSVIKVFVQDANSGVFVSSLTVDAPIPEPTTVALLGIGGAVMLSRGRRRTF